MYTQGQSVSQRESKKERERDRERETEGEIYVCVCMCVYVCVCVQANPPEPRLMLRFGGRRDDASSPTRQDKGVDLRASLYPKRAAAANVHSKEDKKGTEDREDKKGVARVIATLSKFVRDVSPTRVRGKSPGRARERSASVCDKSETSSPMRSAATSAATAARNVDDRFVCVCMCVHVCVCV